MADGKWRMREGELVGHSGFGLTVIELMFESIIAQSRGKIQVGKLGDMGGQWDHGWQVASQYLCGAKSSKPVAQGGHYFYKTHNTKREQDNDYYAQDNNGNLSQ
jgi:hypothetical protein